MRALLLLLILVICPWSSHADPAEAPKCEQVASGYGPRGTARIRVEVLASGLGGFISGVRNVEAFGAPDGHVAEHDVNLDDRGRLRTAVIGPDHELYVTTSNCDGRATCPREGDVILRVTQR